MQMRRLRIDIGELAAGDPWQLTRKLLHKHPIRSDCAAPSAYLRNRDNDPVVSPGTLKLNGDDTPTYGMYR
jgi:hypothetical protein